MKDSKESTASKKLQLQLVPTALNREVSKALACGAKKHGGAYNWRDESKDRIKFMTYIGAIRRHLDVLLDGEDFDEESDAHHLGNIAATCGILLDARDHGRLEDDRPKNPTI